MDEIFIKIFLALVLGGVLGLERQYHDKPAGFATNCLICLGAMLFTVLSEFMSTQGGDPGRIAAQIVTGVGFIGAGSILRDGNKISGLTTAAGVWLVAAIGMAVGFGQYFWAALCAVGILLVQLAVRKTLKMVEFVKHYDTFYGTQLAGGTENYPSNRNSAHYHFKKRSNQTGQSLPCKLGRYFYRA